MHVDSLRIISDELWQRVKARQELQARDLGVRVRTGLRRRRNKNKYLLSGSLRCEVCKASFALSNGTRYQCSSHHEGGNDACSVSLSVPRDRIERVFVNFMASPQLPRQLSEIEARWNSAQGEIIDYRPRITQLETQRANLVRAIRLGGLAAELGAELRALTAELEQLTALNQAVQRPHGGPQQSVERRVARMLERLAEGGEIAQGVVRELFPDGVWLYPDPKGGRFLWAYAQTAWPADWATMFDSKGRLSPYAFRRVYNEFAGEARKSMRVAGSGSGGRI